MTKTIYVAGKVSGLPPKQVKDKFDRVSTELAALGCKIARPGLVSDPTQTWEETMRTDIKTMMECDEVHLLPCWQDSRGARLKRDIAQRLGMDIVYY